MVAPTNRSKHDGNLLRRFVETSPAAMAMFDRDMRYIAHSKRFPTEFRLPYDDLVGLSQYDVFPGSAERYGAVHRRCLAGATESAEEQRFPRVDGGIDWMRWEMRPWHDNSGAIGGVILFVENITARKSAELALRRNEQRYRMALRGSAVTVFEHDLDLRYTWIDNPVFDRTAEDIIGRTDADIFEDAGDAAVTMALKRQVIELGVGQRQEVQVRHKGVARTFDLTIEPLRDDTDAIIGATCAAVETTGRRRMEAALADSEARLRAVLEQIPVAVAIFTPDDRLDLVSRHTDTTLGPPDAGRPANPAVTRLTAEHPDGRPYARNEYPWWRALHQGEIIVAEPLLHRRGDGTLIDLEIYAAPVRDVDGRTIAAVTAALDVSDRKRAAQALADSHARLEARVVDRTQALSEAAHELAAEMRRREQAQAALLQSQKLDALGQMTGGIAHDFRNVLAAVAGSYGLLRRKTSDPGLLRTIGIGEKAVERADRLINQLLAFARRQALRPERLDLTAVLPGVRDFARHTIGPGIVCEVAVEPDVWPILADAGQLEVALLNLVVNARDAMPQGGTIRITARNLPSGAVRALRLPPRDYLAIAVTDTGTGMRPEVAAAAVQPFFTTKDGDKGTGLGLAMVDDFARRSGGGVRIDSEPGAGTTVQIILPRAGADSEAPEDAALPEPEASAHGNAVILFVEDDEQLRGVTAQYLRSLGYSVVEAGSAEAAYALVHTVRSLDLVITDVVMPGADGVQLATRLMQERPGLKLLLITGQPDDVEAAGYTVLRKPFRAGVLARAILEQLGRIGSRQPG
jgi:PAS domain S-box-containing protein